MAENVKTILGLALGSVKTIQGVNTADYKTIFGVDNTGGGTSFLLDEDFEGAGTPTGFDPGPNFDYSAAPLQGLQSLRVVTASGHTAFYSLASAESELYVKFLFRTESSLPGTSAEICALVADDLFTPRIAPQLMSDGTMTLDFANFTVATMAANTTYYVWVNYKVGSGTTGRASAAFNTVDSKPTSGNNFTGDDTATVSGTVQYIRWPSAGFNTANLIDVAQAAVTEF